jgi:hypothetical protein
MHNSIRLISIALLITACSSAPGGTPEPTPRGRSAAIDAFIASREVQAQDAGYRASIQADFDAAADVSLDPSAESARVIDVLRWTLEDYSVAWAGDAGVAWAAPTETLDAAGYGEVASAFLGACASARDALPAHGWNLAPFEEAMVAAEAAVANVPSEWLPTREPSFRGAWACAEVIGVRAGAMDMGAAIAALGPISERLHAAESAEVRLLVVME